MKIRSMVVTLLALICLPALSFGQQLKQRTVADMKAQASQVNECGAGAVFFAKHPEEVQKLDGTAEDKAAFLKVVQVCDCADQIRILGYDLLASELSPQLNSAPAPLAKVKELMQQIRKLAKVNGHKPKDFSDPRTPYLNFAAKKHLVLTHGAQVTLLAATLEQLLTENGVVGEARLNDPRVGYLLSQIKSEIRALDDSVNQTPVQRATSETIIDPHTIDLYMRTDQNHPQPLPAPPQ